MRKKHYVIIASLIGFLWCHDGLCASDRVALVIGNKDYQDAPLKNPVNDANDLSEALSRLGFDVIKKTNVTHQEMERSLREFRQRIEPGGVALFYFSGHGVQVDGTNYLLPVGQTIYGPEEIKFKSVQAGFVLSKMESAGSKVNILILDACRNNPSKGFRSLNEGLAAMDTRGAFIAYSTAPGSVASDNIEGRNGLYTGKLLKTLETPGLTIEELFRRVSYQVGRESDEKQIPWTASGLFGEKPFYFSNPQNNSNKDNLETAGQSNECSKRGTATGEAAAEIFCSLSAIIGSSAQFDGLADIPIMNIACGEAYSISCESAFVRKVREICPQYTKGKKFNTYYRASKGGYCSYSD